MMMLSESSRDSHPRHRSSYLFGLGIRLAGVGTVVMAIFFFFVSESPIRGLREALAWVIPIGVFLWVLAVGLFVAGLAARVMENSPETTRSRGRWPNSYGGRLTATCMTLRNHFFWRLLPPRWTLSFLRSMDGNVLVCLGADYFRELGFRTVFADRGEGGADLWLYQGGDERPMGAVICLGGGTDPVEVNAVREFCRGLRDEEIEHGVVITTGVFSEEASSFAMGKSLELISGEDFLAKLAELSEEGAKAILQQATKRIKSYES